MAEIFSTRFQLGSYVSRQGDVLVPNNAPVVRTEKGLSVKFTTASSSNVSIPSTIISRLSGSIVINFKLLVSGTASSYLLSKGLGGESMVEIQNDGKIRFESDTNNDFWARYDLFSFRKYTEWTQIVFTANAGTVKNTNR